MSEKPLDKITEYLPMPGTVSGMLAMLRRILTRPYVEEVVLTAETPARVTWWPAPGDSLANEDADQTTTELLQRIELEELDDEGEAHALLVKAMHQLALAGLTPTHALVPSAKAFCKLVGLCNSGQLRKFEDGGELNFLGMRLVEATTLPAATAVLLGAQVPTSRLRETCLGVRVVF